MDRLTAKDANALLTTIKRISSAHDLDSFGRLAASSVRALVAGDVCSYVEVNPENGRQVNVPDPADFSFPDGTHELLAANIHEHPVASWHQRTGRGDARAISDFVTPQQFHRSVLYGAFEAIGAEDQIAIGLALRGSAVIAVALNRDRAGFSKRDRSVLQFLRPHLLMAYRNVEARMHLDTLASTQEDAGHAVVILDGRGRPAFATKRAQAFLRKYVGRAQANSLPEPLESWVVARQRPDRDLSSRDEPFIARRGESELEVRFLPAGEGQPMDVLLLQEGAGTALSQDMASLGLTRREGEVVSLVMLGKTTPQIARALDVRPSTVKKHLEHVYAKLGVSSRAALIAKAMRAKK